jgi:hypothetical protein
MLIIVDLPSAWDVDDVHLIHFEKVKPWKGPHKPPLNSIMKFWYFYSNCKPVTNVGVHNCNF